MTFWILVALALYFVQTLLPLTIRYRGSLESMKARDEIPAATQLVGRAERALANYKEALIMFIPLALLTQNIESVIVGAQVFVIARMVYTPIYLMGIPYLRTLVWAVSLWGMFLMAKALF